MSRLRQELDRYLTIRRSLGYDLGTTARVLRRFIAFKPLELTAIDKRLEDILGKSASRRARRTGRPVSARFLKV
jgi:hypothetical protein